MSKFTCEVNQLCGMNSSLVLPLFTLPNYTHEKNLKLRQIIHHGHRYIDKRKRGEAKLKKVVFKTPNIMHVHPVK